MLDIDRTGASLKGAYISRIEQRTPTSVQVVSGYTNKVERRRGTEYAESGSSP